MAGEVEALRDLGPGCRAAFANEWRQRQQLAGIGFRLGGADCAARLGADRDEIVVAPGDGAAVKIEAETKLGEQQQLVAHQRRAPAARRRCRLDRVQQPFKRLVKSGIRLAFGQRRRGQHRCPFDRGGGQRLRQQWPTAVDQLDRRLGELGFGSRRKLRLDDIAGHQHRPHPPPARAANIGRNKPCSGVISRTTAPCSPWLRSAQTMA